MLRPSGITIIAGIMMVAPSEGEDRTQARADRIPVDVTLSRRHQACLADVRGVAGRITAIHLIPSLEDQRALDRLMIRLYWDGRQTPFIACSVKELLGLLGPGGAPVHLPELNFSDGFRIFAECTSGRGGRLQGHIAYETADPPASVETRPL